MPVHTADTLGIDTGEIDVRLAENWSLPTRFYWDSAIFDFEMDAIFARHWQFFCPLHKVMNPGDVAVRCIGRHPIVVTRNRDGELCAFLNICRHRGFTVMERDQSRCLRLVCRYHAWSYDLDGALMSAPDAEGDTGFCRDDLGLRPVAVEQWGTAILIHPEPQARSLRESYPLMFETVDELGFDPRPDDWEPYAEVVYDIETNWKLWYDNGTECYHCPHIHGGSFGAAFDVRPEHTAIRLKEHFSSYTFRAPEAAGKNRLVAEDFISFQLFPGMTYVLHDEFMHMAGMTPLAPGQTRHTVYYFGHRDSDPERLKGWMKIWDDTYREDNEVTAVQYRNLRSARQPYNRYVGSREHVAQHFNAMIWNDYKAALAA